MAARTYYTRCGARLAPQANFCNGCGQPARNPNPSRPRKNPAKALRSCLVIVLAVLAVLVGPGLCLTIFSQTPKPDTDDVPTHLRNQDEKKHLLELVNRAREDAGVPPVRLGGNIAAQVHAEGALERCAVSHWDRRGLKPYMRYRIAGGYQPNGENVSSAIGCKEARVWLFRPDADEFIEEAVEGFLYSPGYRETMLDPTYTAMNAGGAWDDDGFNVVQHFEADRVRFKEPPHLADGLLVMEGRTRNLASFRDSRDLVVVITYDPPLEEMSDNRLARTYCYRHGDLVMMLRPPAPLGRRYIRDSETISFNAGECPDPYHMSPGLSAPETLDEYQRLGEEARSGNEARGTRTAVESQTASGWTVIGRRFRVSADISGLLRDRGSGVYTVLVLQHLGGAAERVAEHSLFYRVKTPREYRP